MLFRSIKENKDVSEILKLSSTLLFIILLIGIIPIILYSKEIMQTLYNEHYMFSFVVLNKLLIGFFGIAAIYIFGTLLTANGNLKYLNLISFLGAGINIILNFILIPFYKANGAAFSSMLIQILMAVLQIVLVIRIFKIKINYFSLVKLISFSGFILAQSVLIKNLINNFKIGFIIMIISSLVFVFIFRIIKLKMIKDLFFLSSEKG